MTEFTKDKSLFCIFHNHGRYQLDGKSISHIFSGIVQAKGNELELLIQDFDGNMRRIDTDLSGKQFDLAAIVPIARKAADAVQMMVDKLNLLDAKGKWPFYFSPDMSLDYKREVIRLPARAPEGHIDPPLQQQKMQLHTAKGERLLVRVNCARMALMTAQMAGIKINNIADVNPLSNTGEEVRDAIHAAYKRIITGRAGQETIMFEDSFAARKKGNDKSEARFALGSDGLCIIQAEKKDFRMGGFCDALARPIQGKSLFNWVSEGRMDKFKQPPVAVPAYLQNVLSLA